MTKYRVINKYNEFWPQQLRFRCWWSAIDWQTTSFSSLEEALEDIEDHKRVFSKEFNKGVVVWDEENEKD